MSLKSFYGYTGSISAKTTARIYLLTAIFLWVFGLICWILIKLHLMSPSKPHTPIEELEKAVRDQGYEIEPLSRK